MLNRLSETFLKLRNRHFFWIDTVSFVLIPFLALKLRLDGGNLPERYTVELLTVTLLFSVIKFSVYLPFGLYCQFWRYASIDELIKIVSLTGSITILQVLAFSTLQSINLISLPRSLPFIDGLLTLLFVGSIRFSLRATARFHHFAGGEVNSGTSQASALIIGAGAAGIALVRALKSNPDMGFLPIAFVDDDPQKRKLKINGLPILGDCDLIPEIVRTYQIQIAIITIPSASGKDIRRIVSICQRTGIETKTLPALQDILKVIKDPKQSLREVQIEDLLRREPIHTDNKRVYEFLQGKRILITGAGGSIGSELCRQIYNLNPKEMILLGHGENSVFNLHQELDNVEFDRPYRKDNNSSLESAPTLTPFIADLRHQTRLRFVFEQFQPDVIFHAAAHKHVPLMEKNTPEAITNNVLGTKALIDLAEEFDVENFVMISTDKVVNPTSVMGASKRVAEMLVLQAAERSGKPFVVVRFGNVLGSRGSVIPTFKRQIAKGGPVTVTHPEMRRYFMTIPEAVQLVLQAVVLGLGGEVVMMDMGKPVKILDLANDLIYLSGYKVDKDIKICFTGLRPGEKLYEELFVPGEEYQSTEHEKLLVVKNAKHILSAQLTKVVADLSQAASENNSVEIHRLLRTLVTGYKDVNGCVEKNQQRYKNLCSSLKT
ncbi:polysaccharide biosynthesis protein [Acaryochloris marina NIES-2412]|uniref:polysaccharide biosynthesis protein n=1 Tax=Acaryochloris marina TaxID=155978 RepID=UPI004059916F